jgi:hypothetical protein
MAEMKLERGTCGAALEHRRACALRPDPGPGCASPRYSRLPQNNLYNWVAYLFPSVSYANVSISIVLLRSSYRSSRHFALS